MDIKEFLKEDKYAVFSGVELLEVKRGWAKAKMEIKPMHLNAANVVQGGALFTLADLAFAAAANSYGNLAMSIQTSINFIKSEGKGTIYAEAKLLDLHKKLGNFQVDITNESGNLIAIFTAIAYRKDIPLPFEPVDDRT